MSRASAAHSDANLALRRVLRNDDGIRANPSSSPRHRCNAATEPTAHLQPEVTSPRCLLTILALLCADGRQRTGMGLHTKQDGDMTQPCGTIYTDGQLTMEN
jgi:hypothetical protein